MGLGRGDDEAPLLDSSSIQSEKPPFKRTGNTWTAVAHIITAVIGSGVLSLAWSMAQLGWIAGPLSMMFFASVTFISASLLCDCYISLDPECGPTRNGSYLQAVQKILGSKSASICGLILKINLFKVGVIYTITSAISGRAIQKSNCYHRQGHEADCEYESTYYMLIFGIIQIVLSQIPDFRNTEWLSIVAAAMSFAYSIIGSLLGFAKVIGDRNIKGSIGGVPTSDTSQKVWLVAQALGDIAFAYPFSVIFLEVQDTLKSPPPEKVTMKKVSSVSVFITTFFYLCCGGLGYAAFGDSAPGNLLTGFGFYEPYWLIDFANACVVIHLLGAYQVYSQPLFGIVERWAAERFPSSGFVNNEYSSKKFTPLPTIRLNPLRLCFRTAYVASTTLIAMIFPYFNQVIGFSGALSFWPMVIYFPVEMYFVQKNIGAWSKEWIILRTFSVFCFFVAMFALFGSIEGLITAKFS